ncbi:MAG TPA: glycosyltransferase family 2 protein [Edaphobacter sp.]|nr:glycosyltransferase family 2 protein [Edaphobacter sp.]
MEGVTLLSLIIPIYRNEENLPRLLEALTSLNAQLQGNFEVVFSVDGSPDRCYELLREQLPRAAFRSTLLLLSRNFGSFSAITAGLEAARGEYFAALAADLQEPPELALRFLEILSAGEADIVFGSREHRSDPFLTEIASSTFWSLFRRYIIQDMPRGGVDVFGCNTAVRNRILTFRESNTNLIALLFWIGFRRAYVGYERRSRQEGKSAWTWRKKLRYSINSIFNFTDIPITLLFYCGGFALLLAILGILTVLFARITGRIQVPGYTPIVLSVMFFGALTSIGLGVIGQYLWLTLQNTRQRPNYIVQEIQYFDAN